MEPILKVWSELLPSLILATGEFPHNNQIMALANGDITVLPKMHASRATHDLVPKSATRYIAIKKYYSIKICFTLD